MGHAWVCPEPACGEALVVDRSASLPRVPPHFDAGTNTSGVAATRGSTWRWMVGSERHQVEMPKAVFDGPGLRRSCAVSADTAQGPARDGEFPSRPA